MPALGHIDAVTSSGFVEGWAVDSEHIARPVLISVVDADGAEVAFGLANLYREDLAWADLGYGWCFFRLKLAVPPEALRGSKLELIDRNSSAVINSSFNITFTLDDRAPFVSIEEVAAFDPFVLRSIEELRHCEPMFGAYIRQNGIRQFIRAAYLYVLGRPADETGITHYGKLIRRGIMMPFALIKALSESDEFRTSNRALAAPTSPDFAFAES